MTNHNNKNPQVISTMFDQIATSYDSVNNFLTFGIDSLWRVATRKAIRPKAGEKILDVAGGTGSSAVGLTRYGVSVVVADFSPGMLHTGWVRHGSNPLIEFIEADATNLPFPDNSFDAVTISYGLRNINDPKKALAEMVRVAKPGARIVICELSHPKNKKINSFYFYYLTKILPFVASKISGNISAYEYLAQSIMSWPKQNAVALWLKEAGLVRVAYRNLSFGVVALHRGYVPKYKK